MATDRAPSLTRSFAMGTDVRTTAAPAVYWLRSEPVSVRDARVVVGFTVDHLFGDDIPDSRLDDVLTVATELLTNAVRHATTIGGMHLTITRSGDVLKIAVDDYAPDQLPETPIPDQRSSDDLLEGLQESGRGLTIVAELSDEWGWEVIEDSHGHRRKSVWAQFKIEE